MQRQDHALLLFCNPPMSPSILCANVSNLCIRFYPSDLQRAHQVDVVGDEFAHGDVELAAAEAVLQRRGIGLGGARAGGGGRELGKDELVVLLAALAQQQHLLQIPLYLHPASTIHVTQLDYHPCEPKHGVMKISIMYMCVEFLTTTASFHP